MKKKKCIREGRELIAAFALLVTAFTASSTPSFKSSIIFEKFALISNFPQEYPRLAVLLKPILTLDLMPKLKLTLLINLVRRWR
jgi:hypothetical protein